MQRTLVLISVLALIAASLAVGALAAHWPFWMRALAWHSAADGWPQDLRGPWLEVRGAPRISPLVLESDASLAGLAAATGADVLMVAEGRSRIRTWFAPGFSAHTLIDGRGLARGLPPLVYGVLQAQERRSLLDTRVGSFIEEWKNDPRGAVTPRQLLWQLSGLSGTTHSRFNPFSAQAALDSGPDFRRAALAVDMRFPPGSHFEPAPANSQILAIVAAEVAGMPYAQLLETQLWSRVAAGPAKGLLDHRRGSLAAHCCFSAWAEDWLRIALLLAEEGVVEGQSVLTADHVRELAAESPVNAGYGLGFRLGADAAGHPQLILETQGRLLVATPGTGRALFWSGRPPAGTEFLEPLMRELSR